MNIISNPQRSAAEGYIFVPSSTKTTTPNAQPIVLENPLQKYSLKGLSGELEKQASERTPLLGKLCLRGEATVWYAKPNTGKTLLFIKLLMDAIENGSISGDEVYYCNFDDSSKGLAEKAVVLDDLDANILSPAHKSFSEKKLISTLEEMTKDGSAKRSFVIIDTLKKCVDLMSKSQTAEFNSLIRKFTMAGGTVLGLAHTNKQPGKDGKPVYSGTSDVMDDFDCAYLIDVGQEVPGKTYKSVLFENTKRRGDVAAKQAYHYNDAPALTYLERIYSIEEGNADEFTPAWDEGFSTRAKIAIPAIEEAIRTTDAKKMTIVRSVMDKTGIPRQQILKVLELHTGANNPYHLWTCERKARGAKVYSLREAEGNPPVSEAASISVSQPPTPPTGTAPPTSTH